MRTKHTMTFEVEDDGVENLKFDIDWKMASAFYKWDHLNDLIVMLNEEYESERTKLAGTPVVL